MYKKIIKSFLNLFLFSAIVHNSILLFLSIRNGDIKYLNYFRIMGLEEFWPNIAQGKMSDLISMITIVAITTIFFMLEIFTKKLNKKSIF